MTVVELLDRELLLLNYSKRTRRAYAQAMQRLVAFAGVTPEALTTEHVKAFLAERIASGRAASTVNVDGAGIKFLFRHILGRPLEAGVVPYMRRGRKLPVVLSFDEVARLLDACEDHKIRAALTTVYATGLRLSEVRHLLVTDIDSERGVVRVDQGKGRKDRYVVLGGGLLGVLREYWRAYRPEHWLFPGARFEDKPIPERTLQHGVKVAAAAAGLRKDAHVHTLRHSHATHFIELGGSLRVLQELLGHKKLETTLRYVHLTPGCAQRSPSPFDALVERSKLKGRRRAG